jgi:hypothetical protein
VDRAFSLILWWAGLSLEPVILARSLRTRTFKNYPIFYLYIACVFVVSAGLYMASLRNSAIYAQWYWPTQLVTLVIGYGVILDVLQKALSSFPGAERVARALGFGIFFVIFFWLAAHFAWNPDWSIGQATSRLERDLRLVEALFLATIIAAVRYYRIHLGRNLKGLTVGMGIYVAVSLVTLALFTFIGHRFDSAWKVLQSGSYLVALAVWTGALWSYAPNPAVTANHIDGDYESLAEHTRTRLRALRDYFTGRKRP